MTTGASRVLAALRNGTRKPCSGVRLSETLGVSRAQIWKHVETLRSRGYTIEGEAGEGYALAGSPDRLYADEILADLKTQWLAQQIEHHDTIDSTNRLASERAREGAPDGTTIIAEQQTAGRGRLGRSFFSPANLNLYTSIVMRPKLSTAEAPTLIHAAAVGCADAIAETVGLNTRVEIKWPNDILVEGLKSSGILMEMSSEANRIDFVILGIGVNLNVDPSQFPEEFRKTATSLSSHTGAKIDRILFAQRLYSRLEAAMDHHRARGFDGVRPRYEALFGMTGKAVRIRDLDGSERSGTITGVSEDGALLLEASTGAIEKVIAGDVTIVKEGPLS